MTPTSPSQDDTQLMEPSQLRAIYRGKARADQRTKLNGHNREVAWQSKQRQRCKTASRLADHSAARAGARALQDGASMAQAEAAARAAHAQVWAACQMRSTAEQLRSAARAKHCMGWRPWQQHQQSDDENVAATSAQAQVAAAPAAPYACPAVDHSLLKSESSDAGWSDHGDEAAEAARVAMRERNATRDICDFDDADLTSSESEVSDEEMAAPPARRGAIKLVAASKRQQAADAKSVQQSKTKRSHSKAVPGAATGPAAPTVKPSNKAHGKTAAVAKKHVSLVKQRITGNAVSANDKVSSGGHMTKVGQQAGKAARAVGGSVPEVFRRIVLRPPAREDRMNHRSDDEGCANQEYRDVLS